MAEEKKLWDNASRLFNLMATVLMAGQRGISKEQLFKVVPAYRDDLKSGTDVDSVTRKFERDKEILRENGFEFDVFVNDFDESLYRIPQRDFFWPEGTELSAKQLQLLQYASKVWETEAVSKESGAAALRLKALGLAGDTANITALQPQIQIHDPAFLPLNQAIVDRYVVRFRYRKPGQTAVFTREVNPWAMRNIGGQWMLTSWDTTRQDVRNFLLKRIVSKVEFVKRDHTNEYLKFPAPTQAQVEAAESDLDELISGNLAKLKIRNGSEAWFRYVENEESTEEWIHHERQFMDAHLLAEELREFGVDVKVEGPRALIDAVTEGYRKVLDTHA